MSTEGTAAVAGLPVAVAGAPVIGLGVLVAGTGILVAQGIMWCYEKLEENYRSACQSYTNLAEAASQETFARQQDRYPLLAAAVNQFTTAPHLRAASGAAQSAQATATPDPRLLEEANTALARAQEALRSSADAQRVREEAERAILRRQLETEIAASQHILPTQVIAKAHLTLDQSSANMRAALDALSSAWKAINDSQQHRAHQERQARVILGNVRQQVVGIQVLAQQHLGQTDANFAQRLRDITDRVKRAEKFLASDPTANDPRTALQVAQEAQKLAQDLEGHLANEVLSRWDEQHKLLLAQRGRLKALADVLTDARAIVLVPATQIDPVARKLQETEALIARAEQATATGVRAMLPKIRASIDFLQEDIFQLVGTGQQQQIGGTIQQTLQELGFHTGQAKQVGDKISILARRQGQTAGAGRDEKLVFFYVDQRGRVAYDFCGYKGDECVREAQRVFDALRAKGVLLADPAAKLPAGNEALEPLRQGHFAPRFEVNKRQERLRQAVLQALRQMGFANIHESSGDGYIELDAFNGTQGHRYHVELTPGGEAKVRKNEQDVSASPSDQLVAKLREVPATQETTKSQEAGEQGEALNQWQQDTQATS